MSKPPPLPVETLARVLRISGIDGFTLVFLAGGLGLVSVGCHDGIGAMAGALAAGAGWGELNGRRRLRAGDKTGIDLLVRSQLGLLVIILLYIVYQLDHFEVQPLLATLEQAFTFMQRLLEVDGIPLASALDLTPIELKVLAARAVKITYIAAGIASIFCQGGLAYYYHSKKKTLGQALRKI